MKRYIKSSTKKYVKATSEYYDMVDMKIKDFFKQYADTLFEEDPEADHHDVADYIAQHMVELLDYEEWEELAFDWLQMNYK